MDPNRKVMRIIQESRKGKNSVIGIIADTFKESWADAQPWVTVDNHLPEVQLAFFLRTLRDGSSNPIKEVLVITLHKGSAPYS